MKRVGFLIEKITDLNNLYLAYYKAAKTKQKKDEVILYKQNVYENLRNLQKQIKSSEIEIGNYKYFTIYEPKKRLICAASFPERVLHHALMNVCHQYFENRQINESYATRIGKGTYKAIEKAQYYSYRNKFYLKLDIRKYFDSIDHNILKQKLNTIFKDPVLLNIFEKIINSYHLNKEKGLPIGNLTSQYFANFYLSIFDSFAKQHLHIKAYVRYMDDVIIWSNNSQELTEIAKTVKLFLKENLNLDLKISYINTCKHGLNFLSYRIFNTHTELQQKSKKRFIKKLNMYDYKLKSGEFSQEDYQRHLMPLVAFTEHASAKGFRKKVFDFCSS